ncbi:hypothetical protein CONCODRAFT_6421 [Conidiobolus coronatus NRRL 28638]|uniref:RNI-like protein n=1 Tax=Conidiobolus coronatus (strain ATCC 28846 / CBS 209.66 / NRRL 28638) TaxID=796925 RepID=A0A137P7I4_CONC2|nr:hypothetical protein CONCODRAFT_6421 [Conidiobolus coronatus NRRL 28638]|eukprot:KXN70973.1 hypothetical protein CONCODRAFT_6421 [Conidiobolus coronatus NRRL 28638]
MKKLSLALVAVSTYISGTQKGLHWGHEDYELKLEYFDTIINRYKNQLQSLTYGGWDYFLIEYFSIKFNNLNSLFLDYTIIPKIVLKNIINNLPNLHSLSLSNIIAAYSKNDPQIDDFKYSKSLKKLIWSSSSQFELDSTDYLSMKRHRHTPRFENLGILDLSLNLVNTLKHLNWYPLATDDRQLFNKIIAKNSGLISLATTLNSFNSESFNYISSNLNLKKLSISFSGDPVILNQSQLPKFPNIKTLEFYHRFGNNTRSIDLLIESCSNLEELKLSYFADFDKYIIRYFKNLKSLKVLTINSNDYTLSILDSILPESNLEQMTIESNYPVKLLHKDEVPDYQELKDWRMVSHHMSTHYWKIK